MSVARPAGAKPTRRSNVERSASTRGKLIDAAIQCLHRYGYAATTTSLIAKQARVSRGAMMHQFPSKVDLMLAVAEHVVEAQHGYYTAELFKLKRGRDRYVGVTPLTWKAWSQPSGTAVIEIMVAARSDPVLAQRFPPLARAIERRQWEDVWKMAQSAGITDRATVEASVKMNLAAVRGLCIDLMFNPDRENLEPALKLLSKYKDATADELIAKASGQSSPPADAAEAAAQMARLQEENHRLKVMLADLTLSNAALQEQLGKMAR